MNKLQRQFIIRGKQPPLDRDADRAAAALDLKVRGAKWKDIAKLCNSTPPSINSRGSPWGE